MGPYHWLAIFIVLCCAVSIVTSDPSATSQVSDPTRNSNSYYRKSPALKTRKRSKGKKKKERRRKISKKTSYSSSRTITGNKQPEVTYSYKSSVDSPINPLEQSYFSNKDRKSGNLFKWNGKSYDVGSGTTKIITSKKTTKTTKVSKSSIGLDGKPIGTTYTYTYTDPGGSSVTRYHNSTTITSGYTPYITGTNRYDSKIYSTNSNQRARNYGVGEEYLRNTEETILDYEEYDPTFSIGPQISRNDRFHPFVIRGFGTAPGFGQPRTSNPCDRSSCYPATGNLLIGRQDKLEATSTCGLRGKEKFCIVSHLKHRKKCFWCDSQSQFIGNPRYSHRIQNIVTRIDPRTERRSWWQSENGKEDVSIQLNLEAEFHFTHLVITFRTFRPAAMLIERSYDFGKTWKVYRYFASNCRESFPGIPEGPPQKITDVVCVSRYSDVAPSTEGEVIFRVLPPNIPIDNPYSDEVQNLLKLTNLRVNFTKLQTLGDQLLDKRSEIKEKYYYAIYDMVVRGSCSCYGHASRCLPLEGVIDRPDMVHGRCECTHHTEGLNCERCERFYNDLPWRPAIGKETNECKRCNCNNHATRCHFDPHVFEQTGRISGGVCDDCSHNTQGRNCEDCKPYYYHEPSLSEQDPNTCQPCNCDLRGSIDDGICDSRTDVGSGLVAGQCQCKENVDGLKCDRCKPGFWNYSSENPLGCQEITEDTPNSDSYLSQPESEWPKKTCSCDLHGTINNAGCNPYTGECQCKRNVVGRDCNQCRPQHYGLSGHRDGCLPCDCDRGGSLDNDCDVIDGQCKCRPHVSGRKCDHPQEGYYVPSLSYLTYEAELAEGSENCQVVMREPYRDGRPTTWTGIGFMRVFDQSSLEFEVDNIETSMEYDLVIKYEPQFRGTWDGVNVRIERPGPVDQNGPCANTLPYDDNRYIDLSAQGREKTVFPTVCLENGKRYKIILDFKRTNAPTDSKSASILIDSVSLIPRAEQLPIYSGSRENEQLRQDYIHYRCSEPFYSAQSGETAAESCVDKHLESIGLYVFGQAYSCQCDGTGSRSSLCDPYGGKCHCKPYVEGRRCDHCAPGTYGFGPEGCTPCECSSSGALDNFCDRQTGKCKCRPNTYGRQCNECQPGYWNFPNCQRCECHGHADTCEARTGKCHECRDYTDGPNCAVCQEGFYGDPRLDVGIACRACPCPGTADSGHSFANRCRLEPTTKDVLCECEIGYAGDRCDVCADNYYGNPEVPGGKCQPCDCTNNIDIARPGNCDSRTGECLKCLFNTDGYNCERCADGFYGSAAIQECRECVCNILGTNATMGSCDHITGQCPCMPNVKGQECNACEPRHWKLASGVGCELCSCDAIGSYREQCNEYNGQCACKDGFGGRQCDQCQQNFFGDPRIECSPCDCNPEGSATLQCDHHTGQCMCLEGIGGFKCDQCARGFQGRAPYCQPCSECFDNWDFIISGLRERTEALIESASQIKQKGATGAYSYEFETMEEKIMEVRNILLTANLTSNDLDELKDVIAELSSELAQRERGVQELELDVNNSTQRIALASNALADLRLQANELKNSAGDLKDKTTELQEENVEGALNLTRHAHQRSKAAQVEVEYTVVIVSDSDRIRKQTNRILIYKGGRFNRTINENDDAMERLSFDLNEMESTIPELNNQVCDRRGDPCDSFCGGAGCGSCGGLSCNDGLVNTAKLAVNFAEDAESLLRQKEAAADELLRAITHAKQKSDEAYALALEALNAILAAQNTTATQKEALEILLKEIDDYFNTQSAKPSEIRALAEEILSLDIGLQPRQITDLAEQIAITIRSLTDINAIIAATQGDLEMANRLKERADRARKEAEDALGVAQRVVKALSESSGAQEEAEIAISKATEDISSTELYLTEISSETTSAHRQANASQADVIDLMRRVENVQKEFTINEKLLDDTDAAVRQASLTAQRSANEATQLEDKYRSIVTDLEIKSLKAEEARERAERLKNLANKLSSEASTQLDELKELEIEFNANESKLNDYEEEIRALEIRMEEYHKYILHKATIYTTCTANKEFK